MLRAIRLENYRSFADSGRIELSDLNVFIGPNSAGKSNLMSVIHLALDSSGRDYASSSLPLPLAAHASFASFDSVLHRTTQGKRPRSFSLTMEWEGRAQLTRASKAPRVQHFVFNLDKESKSAIVDSVIYGVHKGETTEKVIEIQQVREGAGKGKYRIVFPKNRSTKFIERFYGGRPSLAEFRVAYSYADFVYFPDRTDRNISLVRPNRPVPRSLYVLDDPGINIEDRELITGLLRIWVEKGQEGTRKTIERTLSNLGLARHIEVRPYYKTRSGPQIVEVRISANSKKQVMTIADVGFGVSQVLPLITRDAQLCGGSLLAYQPEVHLHPFSQSRLADVFVDSVSRGNRVFIETHSEHLVLRLQTLVANRRIPAHRVRVFCVSHDGEVSSVRTMQFDDRGVPTERWPSGFLDTDLTLADELVAARQGAGQPVSTSRRKRGPQK